jgi:hypothetical protein
VLHHGALERLSAHPRTHVNNFFLVPRWAPEAALRQPARERLQTLYPHPRETLDLIIDDSTKATSGKAMDAVTKMKDPALDAYIRGHQYVCGPLIPRQHVIPQGIRLSIKQEHCPALGVP